MIFPGSYPDITYESYSEMIFGQLNDQEFPKSWLRDFKFNLKKTIKVGVRLCRLGPLGQNFCSS